MLSVYLFFLGVGIVLVGLSLVGVGDSDADSADGTSPDLDTDASVGLDGAHVDADLTVDGAGVDVDGHLSPDGMVDVNATPHIPDSIEDVQEFADLDVDAPHTGAPAEVEGAPFALDLLLVLVSFRFWSFFALFFGLTGAGLTFIGESGPTLTLIISLAMGIFAGYGAHYVTRRLLRWQTSSNVDETELVGMTGEVIIPIEPGAPGRVRFMIKDTPIDRRAYSAMDSIPIGARVRVVRMDETSVWVIPVTSDKH